MTPPEIISEAIRKIQKGDPVAITFGGAEIEVFTIGGKMEMIKALVWEIKANEKLEKEKI